MLDSLDFDVVIIGAGFAGAATAFHLHSKTDRTIAIVEQESAAGMHSSGRNVGIIREHSDEPELQHLLSSGARFIRKGQWADFHRCGIVLVGLGDQPVADFFPGAQGRGKWCPEDGTVDVAALLQGYLKDQQVLLDTKVERWRRNRDGLIVETSRGEIRCRLLINAAGPWAGELGGLPLQPLNRHVFCTGPLSWVDPKSPVVWDGAAKFYFRPESGGLLLCACDEIPAPPGQYREEPAVMEDLAAKIARCQPQFGELPIATQWVGQRTFAKDRNFVIGFDPRDDRVFHVCGLGGHGVTSSYAVGQLAAEMIMAGPESRPSPLSPARLIDL